MRVKGLEKHLKKSKLEMTLIRDPRVDVLPVVDKKTQYLLLTFNKFQFLF